MRRIVWRRLRDNIQCNNTTDSGFPAAPYLVHPTRSIGLLPGLLAVLFQRTNGSVVELVRFNLESFDLADQGVAALFGLELARLVVDTSYT